MSTRESTGHLRRNELFTLTWDNVYLTHTTPFLTVRAAFAKSKKSRHVQFNALAVETLRQWRTMWERNTGNLVFGRVIQFTAWTFEANRCFSVFSALEDADEHVVDCA